MAVLSPASMLHGASGKIGGLIFRPFGNKTVVSACPNFRKKRSELQLANNDKMKIAAGQARIALRNPTVKAHYEKKKKHLNVTSAYTAACTDFMRKGKIDYIDTSKYNKGEITIKAHKADLGFDSLTVKLITKEGKEITRGAAMQKTNGEWRYKFSPIVNLETTTVIVEAKDKIGNTTRTTLEPGKPIALSHHWS